MHIVYILIYILYILYIRFVLYIAYILHSVTEYTYIITNTYIHLCYIYIYLLPPMRAEYVGRLRLTGYELNHAALTLERSRFDCVIIDQI